jgi:3-hydroxyisobutyrate dehydrogenase
MDFKTRGTSMKIGFIGLGMMGRGLVGSLLRAGHDVVVNDLSKTAVTPFTERGANAVDSPKAVAEVADLIFTSLPTPADVVAVCEGDNGLARGFKRGATWFDFSTNAVDVVRRLNRDLAKQGVAFLDAPVSGGPGGAASGKLAIWVGGAEAAFESHRAVLDSMADEVRYLGEIGAGTITKLAHNMASTAIKAVTAEVLTMGVRAGMDPLTLWKAMRSGAAGRMRGFDNIQRFLTGNTEKSSFALRLMQKDINLALQLGRELDVPMRVCAAVAQDVHEAMARGWGARDSQAVLVIQQERAAVAPFHIPEAEVRRVLAEG